MQILKKYFPLLIIVIYFLLQLPFLTADPDPLADPHTRGAFTDEGLYVSQVRNLVNHHYLDLKESDTIVLGPVFNIVQLPFYYLFGTGLVISRIITLLFVLLSLFLFLNNKKLKYFGIFLFLLVMLEFHIFQFSHYVMTEMIGISFILLSIYFLYKSYNSIENKRKIKHIFFSALFLFLCYSTKIQFLYVAAILPVTVFLMSLKETIQNKKLRIGEYKLFLYSFIFTILFAAIYFLFWYLPNKDFYNYLMTGETEGRISYSLREMLMDAKSKYMYFLFLFLWLKEFNIYFIHFYIALGAAFVYYVFIKKKTSVNSVISVFALIWIISEMHKIPMHYVPNRYILSLVVAVGVFIASIYAEFTAHFSKFKYLFLIIALGFGTYNLINDYSAYNRRTYQLQAVQDYLSHYNFMNKPVIGAWSPSVCYENKAITFPVWYKYFNWKEPLKTFKPAVVISEDNEFDSNNAYSSQHINLKESSDSSRVFDVWNYKLVVYWIKGEFKKLE